MSRVRLVGLLASGIAPVLGSAGPAEAQHRIEVTPFIAGYVPTANLGNARVPRLLSQPIQVEGATTTTGAFGGRVGVWAGSRWGFEGMMFYAPSNFRVVFGPVSGTVDANVQGGSLKMFFQATGANTGTDLIVSGGVAGVSHGGDAFALAANQFDLGGTLGGGLHVVMSPQVTFRIDADLLVYRWSFGRVGLNEQRTQTDFLVSLGLALRLAR